MKAIEFLAEMVRLAPFESVRTFDINENDADSKSYILLTPLGSNRNENADSMQNYFDENVRLVCVRTSFSAVATDAEIIKDKLILLHPDMSGIVLSNEPGTPETCQISQIEMIDQSDIRKQINDRAAFQWSAVFRVRGEVLTPLVDNVYVGPY